MRADSSRKNFILILQVFVLILISLGGTFAVFYWLVSHLAKPSGDEIHFGLGNNRSLDIICEGEFLYDPPGYVYYQILDSGKTVVPLRRFCTIGSERVPSGRLDVVITEDGDTIAFRRNFNVMIMHDFKTNRTWPGNYRKIGLNDYLLARELIERFKQEGKELYCTAVKDYYASFLSSPDQKYIVLQVWDRKETRADLKVQVINQEGKLLHELQAEKNYSISMDDMLSRQNWSAGWLSQNRFGVWTRDSDAHVWEFKDDGSCVELPGPLDSELVSQLKEMNAPLLSSPGQRL